MFNPAIFSIFDTLNHLFSVIGTVYVYVIAIALPICLGQSMYAEIINSTAISDEFPQLKVTLRVEPEEKKAPSGVDQGISFALETEVVRDFWADIDFQAMNIRAIRDYVKAQSLQHLVKEAIGKTYSQCTLAELRSALTESQEIDRFFATRLV